MANHSDNITYKLPETSPYAKYRFNKISITIEGDTRPQPATWIPMLILPIDEEYSHLTFSISGITPSHHNPDIEIALYRKGTPYCLQLDNISCDESSYHGRISLTKMEPGEYFLYIGNAYTTPEIPWLSYKSMGHGVAFSFKLVNNGIHYHLPEIQRFGIFCHSAIRIEFKTPIDPGNSWMSYECSRLGDDTVILSYWLEISSDGMYVNMGSRPNVQFIDGEYQLKLYYNNDMKANIHFNLKDFAVTDFVQESI